jgi:hypothetical protein
MDVVREMVSSREQRKPGMLRGQSQGKKAVSEEPSVGGLFSGLEMQSEVSLLLEELYDGLADRASPERVGGMPL